MVGDHVRRLVAASADGTMPHGAALDSCRPDALQALAIHTSDPPMPGGEYWTAELMDLVKLDVSDKKSMAVDKPWSYLL